MENLLLLPVCVLFLCGNVTHLGAGHDKTIRVWDLASSKMISSFSGHTSSVWSMDFSADSNVLASGGADNTVRIWDVSAGAQQKAAASQEKTSPLLKTFPTKNTPVHCVRFTRRNLLLSAGPFSPQ